MDDSGESRVAKGLAPFGRAVVRIGAHAVFVMLLIAGFLKAIDLPGFMAGLQGWSLIPRWSYVPIALGVPTLEIMASALWLLAIHRAWALRLSLGLLTTMTLALCVQYVMAPPPSCHCFGALRVFEQSRLEAVWAAVRNLTMIAVLLPAFARLRKEGFA
ncbi:MAG: hypothetical protein HBSAPP03_17340 [Phycisphaerae bacterium]|nr:MAG: hypothetical protein HBSAPP03_17340 [Phycisphaerae bacterium]